MIKKNTDLSTALCIYSSYQPLFLLHLHAGETKHPMVFEGTYTSCTSESSSEEVAMHATLGDGFSSKSESLESNVVLSL